MPRKFRVSFLQTPGAVAILLITLVLLVQYGGARYGFEILRISKEAELENHLKDLGRMAPGDLVRESLALADAAYEVVEANPGQAAMDLAGPDSPLAEQYLLRTDLNPTDQFERFAANARLMDLALLDDSGRVLYSVTEPDRVWGAYELLEMDRPQFEQALNGLPAGSLAYRSKKSPLKRVYIPIVDPEIGGVSAVLCMTAGRDFLAELEAVADAMTVLTSISTALVLLIGWLVYRLLKRQKLYERQVAHADRLSSLGTLAAGFAHEVRNPLEIIGACTEDLERTLRDSSAPSHTQEACRDILEEVERLNRLVGQFLQFSKADVADSKPGSASVTECLTSSISMLRHPAEKKRVSLVFQSSLVGRADRVPLSEGSLKQIIINLVMNAIQASSDEGRVEIEAASDSNGVRISVSDTGPGILAANRGRIFEPFFTTRPEGAGLGLAIAHKLVGSVGGSLELLDRADRGACFLLTLPLVGRVAKRGVETSVREAGV